MYSISKVAYPLLIILAILTSTHQQSLNGIWVLNNHKDLNLT